MMMKVQILIFQLHLSKPCPSPPTRVNRWDHDDDDEEEEGDEEEE